MSKNNVLKIGEVYENPKRHSGNGRGAVYDSNGICPTLVTMKGGGNKPFVIIKEKAQNTAIKF